MPGYRFTGWGCRKLDEKSVCRWCPQVVRAKTAFFAVVVDHFTAAHWTRLPGIDVAEHTQSPLWVVAGWYIGKFSWHVSSVRFGVMVYSSIPDCYLAKRR